VSVILAPQQVGNFDTVSGFDIIITMRAERKEKYIGISLTAEEVYALQSGKTIGDRPSVTMMDAKVEVLPLSAIEEDNSGKDRYSLDRLEKGISAPLRGMLYPDGDLVIFVPEIKLSDVRIAGAILPREEVKAPSSNNPEELITHVLPPGGIKLLFGGSLKIIDILSYFYQGEE